MKKVSIDYYFKNCKYCPLVKDKGDEYDIGFGRYLCTIGTFFVPGEGIPDFCPLKDDPKDKIYTIRSSDIQ